MNVRALASLAASVLVAAAAVVQPVGAAPAAAASSIAIDTTSRSAVDAAYQTRWLPAATTAVSATAQPSSCTLGAPSAATVARTFEAWNFARGLAGLDPVVTDPGMADGAQAAALVFSRNDTISHDPPSSWACWSSLARDAASWSNIGIAWGGRTPTAAELVNGYLTEKNDQGTNLGHRRWMLHPPITTSAIGVAHNPSTGSGYGTNTANAIRVIKVGSNTSATKPAWVPWPTAGYFPAPLEPGGLWSLTSSSASSDFSKATVSVVGPSGTALPVTTADTQDGFGNATLAFRVSGVTAPAAAAEAVYTVTVSNIAGAAASSYSYQVKLFNPGAPIFTTSPTGGTLEVGDQATFTVAATGSPAPAYLWQRSPDGGKTWTTVPGATATTYSFVVAAGDNGALYRAVASNTYGWTASAAAGLTVISTPQITTQPASTSFPDGGSVTLSVQAIGVKNATWAWQRWNGSAWASVTGGTGPSLTLSNLRRADHGARLRVVITSPGGSTTSNEAVLTFDDRAYVPVTPARLYNAIGGAAPNQVTCVQVAGAWGVPVGASGVAVNVTTVAPRGPGHVVVYPDTAGTGQTPAPWAATVNFDPGRDVANAAMVALPADGKICYLIRGATAGLLIDVTGFTMPGAEIAMQMPQRVEARTAVAPHEAVTIQVTGRAGVPAGATAVLLNVGAAGSTSAGNLRLYEAGTALPSTSTLNYPLAGDKSNAAVVQLSDDGKLTYWSDTVPWNRPSVYLDVVGWTVDGSSFVPVQPERLVDHRSTFLTGGKRLEVTLPSGTMPAGATAAVLNVVAVAPGSWGNMRVFPYTTAGATPPPTSTLNYIPGEDVANMVVTGIGSGNRVVVYTDQVPWAGTRVIVDVVGYMTG
ncbi:CAP domain-containing protein [Actinotalea solisilvae]|uniref:CAP domain-containing protein n=1 Tax=Actinotalea solisilvae TaxID=2072922 RepID=UPI0018F128E7|nr:CAP domain-containing protein [Actinotalea solisilvae]